MIRFKLNSALKKLKCIKNYELIDNQISSWIFYKPHIFGQLGICVVNNNYTWKNKIKCMRKYNSLNIIVWWIYNYNIRVGISKSVEEVVKTIANDNIERVCYIIG